MSYWETDEIDGYEIDEEYDLEQTDHQEIIKRINKIPSSSTFYNQALNIYQKMKDYIDHHGLDMLNSPDAVWNLYHLILELN